MIVAPAGGAGAFPLFELGVAGVVGLVVPEGTVPVAPVPVNCPVVTPTDDVGLAVDTPQPVIEKRPIDNVPMAQNPCRFNCIKDLSVGGGSRQSGQSRRASTLDISGEACMWIKEFALVADWRLRPAGQDDVRGPVASSRVASE